MKLFEACEKFELEFVTFRDAVNQSRALKQLPECTATRCKRSSIMWQKVPKVTNSTWRFNEGRALIGFSCSVAVLVALGNSIMAWSL